MSKRISIQFLSQSRIIPFLIVAAAITHAALATVTAAEETDLITCDLKTNARMIRNDQKIVPSKIYHYGKKEILMKDVQARTVPLEDWDAFIMGRGPNAQPSAWKLEPFRRGLYGTVGLDTNDFVTFGSWLMEIQIEEECRDPKYVVSVYELSSDSRFQKWFQTAANLPVRSWEEAQNCFPSDLDAFIKAIYIKPPNIPETACQKLVNQFLDEAGMRIVLDDAVLKSFYIRDRSCIKTILGTAEELVEILASTPRLWTNTCTPGGIGANFLPFLLPQYLASTVSPIDRNAIERLRAQNQSASYPRGPGDEQANQSRQEVTQAIIDSFERCQSQGNMESFRKAAKERASCGPESIPYTQQLEWWTQLCAPAAGQ